MECDAGVVDWRAGCDDVQGLDLAPGMGIGGNPVVDGTTEGEGEMFQGIIEQKTVKQGSNGNVVFAPRYTLAFTKA